MPRPPTGPPFPFVRKGHFRIIVLRALEEHPMHGYEIIKILEDRSHGFYKPSPGVVYPALRSLLRRGYVAAHGDSIRRTYRITAKGRALLREHEADMEARFRSFEASVGPERAALMKEMRTMGKLLGTNLRSVTPNQAKRIRKVVLDARSHVLKILAE